MQKCSRDIFGQEDFVDKVGLSKGTDRLGWKSLACGIVASSVVVIM